jgi:hypothetical protein
LDFAVFDGLPKAERSALLATVARGLTEDHAPCPDLTALTEGTVAAIFAHIRYQIEVEFEIQQEGIDSQSFGGSLSHPLREMLLAWAG